MTTGFGLVGCGMISNFHAEAVRHIRGAKLAACYDTIPASADRFAAANGCKAYHDLDEMLADPEVHVVTICTPSGAHMDPAVAAAKAGKHVVVEKPLEITLKRCDAIIDACDKAGVQALRRSSRRGSARPTWPEGGDRGAAGSAGSRSATPTSNGGGRSSTTTAAAGAAPGHSTAAAPT